MNNCKRCDRELTDKDKATGLGDLCQYCDAALWDDIAWLTGTGRFAQ